MIFRFLRTSLFSLHLASATLAAQPPSVIVIIADDQGWGDLSCHGNSNLATPTLDTLRSEGASFNRFYVQPVCSPTRAELLTSCYAPRVGVTGVTAGGERLDPDVPTIADAFRAAGYATAAFGKWHNGTQAPYHPLCRGFDHYYGFTSGHWANYFAPMLDRNGQITQGKGYLTNDLTDEAIAFVREERDQSFFALVAYNIPHSPMQVPDRWWSRHAEQELAKRGTLADRENQSHTRAALAMCENIDWNVGRILAALDEGGMAENTIVVYMTDNGPNGHRYNAGLRGIKGSTDDGGVRSPLFMRWPAKIPAETVVDQLAGAIDLAPTLAELTGTQLLPGKPIDGVSFAAHVLGETQATSDRKLFSYWHGRTAIRQNSLVLDEQGRLYDLSSDPNQTNDLTTARPKQAERLRQEAKTWNRTVVEANAKPKPPFTVGHPALPSTQLPARDATTRGEIQRSNRHFNSTYFTHWTTMEDTIVWDVEVVDASRFRATVYYTCPKSSVGSLVELRLGKQTCRGRITLGYDPPLIAAKQDRVARMEGDMKAFRPLELGEIALDAGRGELTLQAVEIPGEAVMDLRLLELTRLEQ